MRLGLISDTHGRLRPQVFDIFQDVDRIVHAGDVGDPGILAELEAIAPLTAVWGNTDGWEIRNALPERAQFEVAGVIVEVIHGQQYGSPTARVVAADYPNAGLVVFGHSHRPEVERVGSVLAVNPGSAGPKRFDLPVTVALAHCEAGQVSARIVHLLEG